jgi:hypothetical protein
VYNWALIKVDWLADCIALRKWLALYWSFSSGVDVKFAQSSIATGKQGLIPKEMSQTLLINKKQGLSLHQ